MKIAIENNEKKVDNVSSELKKVKDENKILMENQKKL